MNWNDLTMAQKNELMQTYIKNGVTSLDQMRSHFNSFANGGPRKSFNEWSNAMKVKYPWLELDSQKAGYDYNRYYNENYDDAWKRLEEEEARHFTDRYKLPNHPTFSNESVYSQGPGIGGSWTKDDEFIPSVINIQQHPNVYKEYRPYTEDEIYGKKFATGGDTQPDNPPFILPVNEEGIPYYTLPDLEVAVSKLPLEYNDANVNRYAEAIANGQIGLNQIPNQRLRNAVRAQPIMDRWHKDMNDVGPKVIGSTLAVPFGTIGAISAAPTVNAIMTNPIVDAAATAHGILTAPGNIVEGIQNFDNGNVGEGVMDLGLTALDLYGAGKLVKHGDNALKRLAEVFVRQGDNLHNMTSEAAKNLLTKKETVDYVIKGGKHPELAYKTGPYSGNRYIVHELPTSVNDIDYKYINDSHPGDVVDAFFGKSYNGGKQIDISDVSPEMQKYIKRHYKNKNVRAFDLGEIDNNYHRIRSVEDVPNTADELTIGGKSVLDPGGYRTVKVTDNGNTITQEAEDIWKFNPEDYKNRYANSILAGKGFRNKLEAKAKVMGLRFIDHYGNPVVHKWTRNYDKFTAPKVDETGIENYLEQVFYHNQ